MSRDGFAAIWLLKLGDGARVELELCRRDCVREVMGLRGADDRRCDGALLQYPCGGDLGAWNAMDSRQRTDGIDDLVI